MAVDVVSVAVAAVAAVVEVVVLSVGITFLLQNLKSVLFGAINVAENMDKKKISLVPTNSNQILGFYPQLHNSIR